jgi:hypothetical protein
VEDWREEPGDDFCCEREQRNEVAAGKREVSREVSLELLAISREIILNFLFAISLLH